MPFFINPYWSSAPPAPCDYPPYGCNTSVTPYCVTNFNNAWNGCTGLTSFPLLDVSNGTNFGSAWNNCSSLTSFPLLDVSNGTNFFSAWFNCSSLTSFPLLDVSSGTNFSGAWLGCNSLTPFPLLNVSSGTNFSSTWTGCNSLTSFPLLDVSKGVDFNGTWLNCNSLTSFPLLDVSSGTNFGGAWANCGNLTTFPSLNVSNGTEFIQTWANCASLTSFPLLDVSSGTNFNYAWAGCASLISFPLLNVSNGFYFDSAWLDCNSLSSFPLLDVSSGISFYSAWQNCTSLTSFPAGMFNSCSATDFTNAWQNCALDQTSVDNILVSLDTAGQSNGTVNIDGGTSAAPSATGLAAKDSLEGKGWTVVVNSAPPGVPFSLVTLLLHMNGNTFVDSGSLAVPAAADGGLVPVSAPYAISGGKVAEFTSNRNIHLTGSQGIAAFNFGTGDFTIEFFCYFSGYSFPSTSPVITAGDYTGDGFYLWLASGMPVFTHRGENYTAGSAANMTLNAMNHIACVRQDGVLSFWVNGQLTGTPVTVSTSVNPATGSARSSSGQRVVIGNMMYHGYMSGQLEEVRAVMDAVYTATFTPPSAPFPGGDLAYSGASDPLRSLVRVHLGFSGSSASNSIGGTTISAPSGVVTDTTGGQFGGTYLVCDASRQLNVADITGGLGAGEFTIEAWVYISEPLGLRNFLDTRSGDGSNGIDLYTNGRVSTSGIWIFTESSNIPTGQWFHYAVTRDKSGTMVRWINGVEDATSRDVPNNNFTGPTLKVGNDFVGRIYQPRVTVGAAGSGACRYTGTFTLSSGPFPIA